MASRAMIDEFLGQRALAVVGASRSGKKFGNVVLRELAGKGYRVLPVHPEAAEIDGQRCWSSLSELPEEVGGVVVVVPPEQGLAVVDSAADAGLRRLWVQQGGESPALLERAAERGLEVVSGECILMFAEPAEFYHRMHRWVWAVMGKLPE